MSNYHKTEKRPGKIKRNSNSRRPGRDTKQKSDAVMDKTKYDESTPVNDPNWYFTDQNLATQVSDFSFNQFTGVPFVYHSLSQSELSLATTMCIYLNPSAGYTPSQVPLSAGINMQALRLYTELSANNAKTTNYAPR